MKGTPSDDVEAQNTLGVIVQSALGVAWGVVAPTKEPGQMGRNSVKAILLGKGEWKDSSWVFRHNGGTSRTPRTEGYKPLVPAMVGWSPSLAQQLSLPTCCPNNLPSPHASSHCP